MIRMACLMAGAAVIAAPLAFAAAPAAPAAAAAPLHGSGATPAYPRLTKFPDGKIMAKINGLLATAEKDNKQGYADCLSQLKEMKMKADKDSYTVDVTVRYLSGRVLSVEVLSSYDCAGAYPTNGAEMPLSYDLSNGTQIDWATMFKPGFLTPLSDAEKAPPSALTKLYRARYKGEKECRGVITDMDPFSGGAIVWLDAKGGIVFQPDFPHVTAACADPLTLSPAEVAPYLKDAKLAADLKATVHK